MFFACANPILLHDPDALLGILSLLYHSLVLAIPVSSSHALVSSLSPLYSVPSPLSRSPCSTYPSLHSTTTFPKSTRVSFPQLTSPPISSSPTIHCQSHPPSTTTFPSTHHFPSHTQHTFIHPSLPHPHSTAVKGPSTSPDT